MRLKCHGARVCLAKIAIIPMMVEMPITITITISIACDSQAFRPTPGQDDLGICRPQKEDYPT
jgi:hypothetical protein